MEIKERYKFFDDTLSKNFRGVDWNNSIGLSFKIIYNWNIYEFKVVKYCNETKHVTLSYNGDIRPSIHSSNLKKCAIGKIIGSITNEFKINIGENLKDKNRDINILDRIYDKKTGSINNRRFKQYKYICNNCGYIGISEESHLLKGCGCPCCCVPPRKIILGINTIWDTDRWMVDIGVSENDAKQYSKSSDKKITVKCKYCGNKRDIKIQQIYKYKKIPCVCSKGYSKPEKYMYSLLTQLGVKFIKNYSPDYLVRYENGKKSRKYSDFFVEEYNVVIETDGGMNHINGKVHSRNTKTIEYYIDVDNWKDNAHLKNGIKTIRIDCKDDNFDKFKNNIINSEMSLLFELGKIDWDKCIEFATDNIVKVVCDYWNVRGECETTKDLSNLFNLNKSTIIKYLKQGNTLGWCDYNPRNK